MKQWSRRLVYLIFFLSGLAALIYEISWSRQFGLLFGHTVHAASVVLASYFAGMAVGYAAGGYLSNRVRPLVGYAVAELVVAGWAFVIPLVLQWSECPWIAGWLTHESVFWQIAARASFSFLLLMPATIALGVTLPMMATWLAEGRSMARPDSASRISFAYALNTGGALVGVTVATLWLIVNCGVCGSSYIAAVLSLVCACIALVVGRQGQSADGNEKCENAKSLKQASPKRKGIADEGLVWRLKLAAVVTGFSTLALQVLYTRMFSLVFHNSTYTFGIVVAVFLSALALGAACAARLNAAADEKIVLQRAGWFLAGASLYAVVSVRVFVALTDLDYFRYGDSFAGYMTGATGLVMLVVGPGVFLAGIVLPLIWRVAGTFDDNAGRVVGQLTSANTIAAAIGALAASFLMLPLFGLWAAFVVVAGLMLSMSVALLSTETRPKRLRALGLRALGLLWVVLAVLTCCSPTESGTSRREGEVTIERWNSPYGWIDLVKHQTTKNPPHNGQSDVYKIRQNLHYRFGKTGSNAREYRQAHLPLFMHEAPRDVLFLGLGTGLTAAGAIPHQEVISLTAVELIPEVVEAARALAKHNFNVVDHEKSKMVCDDGRHFLLATEQKYDVIVSDLFVPWESESGYLYTVEHYEVAAKRLNENGLFCQWLPLYQVGEKEFEAIANSFSSVFPSVTVWWGKLAGSRGPVIALVGTFGHVDFDSEEIDRRIEQLGKVMDVDPSIARADLIVDHFVGRWSLGNSQGPVVLNRDEYPIVEFSTPISNRDRQLISGHAFEEYYLRVLSKLAMEGVTLDDKPINNSEQLRARQSLLLFGGSK